MISIAIADDHEILRKGVIELLSHFDNLEVIMEAGNGKELLVALQQAEKLPDVCILDISMPEMNGYETATALRKQWPDIKILALSMYSAEYNIIKMLQNGANGYALKGESPAELHNAIVNIYERGFYRSSIITTRIMHMLHDPQAIQRAELTDNELKLLEYCCSELTYKEIAALMGLSPRTIDGYRESLFKKLQVNTRTGLAMYAVKAGVAKMFP